MEVGPLGFFITGPVSYLFIRIQGSLAAFCSSELAEDWLGGPQGILEARTQQ